MKILVVANGKGGVGKTTTAVTMAAILAETHRVLLVDADRQSSAIKWVSHFTHDRLDVAQNSNPDDLAQLRAIDAYEVIVVDTPPALHDKALQTVINLADFAILPTRPSSMDIMALIETVHQTIKPLDASYRVLLTQVDTRRLREAAEAQHTLSEVGIPTFEGVIRMYKAHEIAALEGQPVSAVKTRNAPEASADYRTVLTELNTLWS
jgi:chromosome partitioning protein